MQKMNNFYFLFLNRISIFLHGIQSFTLFLESLVLPLRLFGYRYARRLFTCIYVRAHSIDISAMRGEPNSYVREARCRSSLAIAGENRREISGYRNGGVSRPLIRNRCDFSEPRFRASRFQRRPRRPFFFVE